MRDSGRGKEREYGGGRKRKHKATAVPQENGLIKSDLHLKNRKQVKCVISKDMCESTTVVKQAVFGRK